MPNMISPKDAYPLIESGDVVLIDIRTADEYAREYIAKAHNKPLDELNPEAVSALQNGESKTIIFHCMTGNRTANNVATLERCAPNGFQILDGGLTAWKKAGLPTIEDKSQPLPIMRQVQMIAGFLVLVGVILGALFSPWFYLLSGFVGAGLMFAGITGYCGMAVMLMKCPWNCQKSGSTASCCKKSSCCKKE